MPRRPPATSSPLFRFALVFEAALVGLAVGVMWLADLPIGEKLRPPRAETSTALVQGMAATGPMLVVFFAARHSRLSSLRRLRRQVERFTRELFPTGSWWRMAVLATLAGVGEELLFRGALQPLVARWTTPGVGLAVASVVFGLAHAASTAYFILATFIGLYLGWLALQTGGLVTPIVAHTLYDFVALVWLARGSRQRGLGRRQ